MNSATGGKVPSSSSEALTKREELVGQGNGGGVWMPPRGGMKRGFLGEVCRMVTGKGGVGEEVLGALRGVEVG